MEFLSSQAIYLQIAHQMAERILRGEWKPGERIPSIRDTAAELQVNQNTVMRTYAFLQDEAIISNQRGIGYFVADEGVAKSRILKRNTFIEELLPQVFTTMDVLEIDMQELQTLYNTHKQHPHEESK